MATVCASTTYGEAYSRYERRRPSSAKLAGVKFELYHPALPTLRRMSMDDVTHKLPTEHARTTTPCDRGEFTSVGTTLKRRGWSDPNLPCQTILSKRTSTMLKSTPNLEPRRFTENWRAILSAVSDHTVQQNAQQKHTRAKTDPLQLQISGLASRVTHPNITGSWQYHRTSSAHSNRPTTPRQRPANTYNKYRSLSVRVHSSANPWK